MLMETFLYRCPEPGHQAQIARKPIWLWKRLLTLNLPAFCN